MNSGTNQSDMLSGSIPKQIIRLAVPMILGFVFVSGYHCAEGELLELILAYLAIIFIFTPVNLLTIISNSIFQGGRYGFSHWGTPWFGPEGCLAGIDDCQYDQRPCFAYLASVYF